MSKQPIKKTVSKQKKLHELIVRQIACFQLICEMNDETLKSAFELSDSDLKSIKGDPVWAGQIRYLRLLEETQTTDVSALFSSLAESDAMFWTWWVETPYQEPIHRWFARFVAPRFIPVMAAIRYDGFVRDCAQATVQKQRPRFAVSCT